MKLFPKFLTLLGFILCYQYAFSQSGYELNSGWQCASIDITQATGNEISKTSFSLKGWKSAVVPGTVLTTMLKNKEIPDPFFGMNNKKIPDIYDTGRDYYTYWFVKGLH